jgi:vacuolar-type H+-ATPase subunit H
MNPVEELLQTEREAQAIIQQAQEQGKHMCKQARLEAEQHLEEFKKIKEEGYLKEGKL